MIGHQANPSTASRSSALGGVLTSHCRANMAHVRKSRPDLGLGVQVQVTNLFNVVPSWLGSGLEDARA